MEEKSKWYLSTGVIVLVFIFCWPIAVVLLIIKNVVGFKIEKKSKIAILQKKQKNYQTVAIVFLVLTLVFVSIFLFDGEIDFLERLGDSIIFLALFGIPSYVYFNKAKSLKRTINNMMIYNDLVVIRNITSIKKLSEKLNISQEQVLRFVSEMIRQNQLDAYIKDEKEIILKEVNDRKSSTVCTSCGAKNMYIENRENFCEYCGTILNK